MSDTAQDALEVSNVSHSYGQRVALDDVSLSVVKGRFCALLGLNGAGKTTLFSLVTRLFDNTTGQVRIMGADVRRQPQTALRQLGVVFQNQTLDPDLSVYQNLKYQAALHGIPTRQAKPRINEELARMGLADRITEKVAHLSGGQRRRLEIARALIHAPRLLLLDEPTVGLDVAARQEIIAHVRGLLNTGGPGVLWATHLLDEIEEHDDIVILHNGRVRAAGNCASLCEQHHASDIAAVFSDLTRSAEKAA